MSMIQQQPTALVADNVAKNIGGGHLGGSAGAAGAGSATPGVPMTPPAQMKRLNMEKMVEEFSGLLGKENWSKYAQIISLFILGKLSRKELVNELDLIFTPPPESQQQGNQAPVSRGLFIRLHNQMLLAILANSLRDSALGESADGAWGFNNGTSHSNKRRLNKHNSQIETYKKIVMSLPIQDRNRLKMITKEAGKRGFVLCSVLQARLNLIPKIPIVTNPETLKRVKASNLKTPLEWSQEIVNGFSAPLATESYSLPDSDSLYLRMISIAREHGLVGAVDGRCVEILSLALENYLKNVLESAIDTVRYREKKYSDYYDLNNEGFYQEVSNRGDENVPDETESLSKVISLTNEDMAETFTIYPNLVAHTGAYFKLNTCELLNYDDLVNMKSSIDDLPEFLEDKPNFTPVDDKNVGTRDELNWLIKDILTKE
ncbi:LAFE_0C02718g1_1 [Lachancea fermentati]|uniref:LAFE_0C02718g1_1 n=1 Tax=Lachancea fermentati TaxID=4955 RepID=A0A1G4M963_LACFM|nr:LAFE_0C02718g1_1 [Lachancea fermentati]